ncbi:long tail fiber proximal subunit [Vibrio phage vB_VmeM-32]|nr:long tail fiber proximal subunit [Vibrio phage vB_VmeM-32]
MLGPKKFRASSGLDASGKKVVNVETTQLNQPFDATNVEFFIRENTVQEYDPTRKYETTGFVVKFNNRFYQNLTSIVTPEPFNDSKWRALSTDVKYRRVLNTGGSNGLLRVGDFILSNVVAQDAIYTLPLDTELNTPTLGDSVSIYDEAGSCNEFELVISGNGKLINGKTSYRITVPRSRTIFVYNGNQWIANTVESETQRGKLVSVAQYTPTRQFIQLAAGDEIMRESRFAGDLVMRLPRYANHGDMIYTADLDALNHRNRAILDVHPESGHTITIKHDRPTVTRAISDAGGGFGRAIFDESVNTWRLFDGDLQPRWRVIQNDYVCENRDLLSPYSEDSNKTINITLPVRIAGGNSVSITMAHMIAGSKIKLVIPTTATDSFIFGDVDTLETPQLSTVIEKYQDKSQLLSKEIILTSDGSDRTWTFVYQEKTMFFPTQNVWFNTVVERTDYRVDSSNPERHGIAAIATQSEVNKNHEDIDGGKNKRDSEAFVTPETLANKTSTETRRGIARFATSTEANATSGSGESWDGVILTPKKLNDRIATTSRRGVARLATQAQANAMSGSGETWTSLIITPQTLDGRKSTETQTGITQQVIQSGNKQTARTTKGSGIHDYDEHYRYVTPKTLFEKVSTETSQGMGFVATQAETNVGTVDNVNGPLFITASKLHARQATTTLTGLTRAATNAETLSNTPTVGNNIHVTPSELVKRTATETRWGLAETATQVEVDAGTLHDRYFVTPKTFSEWLKGTRIIVDETSGLRISGNLWDGHSINIEQSSATQRGTLALATQSEVNGSSVSDKAITPQTLHGRTATTSRTGIAALATQSEVDAGTNNTKIVTPQTLRVVSDERYVNRTGDSMNGSLTINHSDGLVLTDPNSVESWGALRVGARTDSAGNTTQARETSIWTRHQSNSVGARNINTVFKDSGGFYCYGNGSNNLLFDLHGVNGSISNKNGVYSRLDVGPLYLRPNGQNSSTNQATLSTNGIFTSQNFVSLSGEYQSDVGKVLRLIPANDATKSVDITSGGNVTTKGNLSVATDVGVGRDLNVTRNANVTGTLIVTDNATFKNNVSFEKDVTVTGKTTLNGLLEINTPVININRVAGNSLVVNMGTIGGISFDSQGDMSVSPDRSGGVIKIRPSGLSNATNEILINSTGMTLKTNQRITAAATPTNANHLANKGYVDQAIDDVTLNAGNRVSKLGDTMTGPLVVNSSEAIVANGTVSVKDLLTVSQLRIDVGNGEFVEIRPNRQNYTIEFVWISN